MSKTGFAQQIQRGPDGKLKVGGISGVPNIAPDGLPEAFIGEPSAWFLGPQAENQDLLSRMVTMSLTSACESRRSYPKDRPDPEVITPGIKQSLMYRSAARDMLAAHEELVGFLAQHATPFSSQRYQGHMTWDSTLPALAAYFAAMLYNPNNVTIEASTGTTPLGILVGWDLCQMVGYATDPAAELEPWAHITADGTVANLEAAWASRESIFLPLSLRRLLENGQIVRGISLAPVREMPVRLCDGSQVEFAGASPWQLANLERDEVLALPARMARLIGLKTADGKWDEFAVWDAVQPHTLSALGWTRMMAELSAQGVKVPPALITPATQHYCWPKAAALCGLGHANMLNVVVDEYARMRVKSGGGKGGQALEDHLARCLESRTPVMLVVAVTGTTEEGAVDSLEEILELRSAFRARGLNFSLHIDAAWGGYFVTALRKSFKLHGVDQAGQAECDPAPPRSDGSHIFIDDLGGTPMSDYVARQYRLLRHCDSITIDPHKMGYVQYPAGSVLYRNGRLRRLTTFSGAYIGGGVGTIQSSEPTVGIYGIEGSKPGAAAAAVFLSHRVIRPSSEGHGLIINLSLINTKLFYIHLMLLNRDNPDYEVTPLSPLPGGMDFGRLAELRDFIEQVWLTSSDPPGLPQDLRTLGPDLNVCGYVFNPKDAHGEPNRNWLIYQRYNEMIYDAFHIRFNPPQPKEDFPGFFLTKTTFLGPTYGAEFMDAFAARIGLENRPSGGWEALHCLRSVVMDPYAPISQGKSFFGGLAATIDQKLRDVCGAFCV